MRIVLGWELGGNWGHARRLGMIADGLSRGGHEVHLVLQRPAEGRGTGRAGLWQAPVWRGLLRFGGMAALGEPQRFGDVLANLGLRDSGEVEGILRAWDSLLALLRPDAAIADFAPGLVMAAQGRVPVVAVGTGFTVPPTHLPAFPDFPGVKSGQLVAEPALLALINHARQRTGRGGVDSLPAALAADAALPAVFAELDPYRAHRKGAPVPPFVPGSLRGLRAGDAPTAARVFAYFPANDLSPGVLRTMAELAARLPVTAVTPGIDGRSRVLLARAGIDPRLTPCGWSEIARDHSLVLCAGGMGTVSSALVAGVPLAVMPSGIEQRLTARALLAAGLMPGGMPEAGEALVALAGDAGALAQARGQAAGFRARLGDPVAAVLGALEPVLRQIC